MRVNAYKLLEDALNLRDTKIYDTIHDADGDHRVLNKQETMLAQQAQESIREAFKQWIFKDLDRREDLCATYNRIFNAIRPREYDGSHIRFEGMTPEISLMPHQKCGSAHSVRQQYAAGALRWCRQDLPDDCCRHGKPQVGLIAEKPLCGAKPPHRTVGRRLLTTLSQCQCTGGNEKGL